MNWPSSISKHLYLRIWLAVITGVAVLMLLETVFPPSPSEVIMTVAGVSASRGHMTLAGTIAAGTAGAMLGNWFWYWLWHHLGSGKSEDQRGLGIRGGNHRGFHPALQLG